MSEPPRGKHQCLHQCLHGGLAYFPEPSIAAEKDGAAGDRRRAQDRFAQFRFTDNLAFRLGGVDDLRDAFLTHTVKKMSDGDRRGTEWALQAQLPQPFTARNRAAAQDASVIQNKNLFAHHDGAGRAGTKSTGLPKLFWLFRGDVGLDVAFHHGKQFVSWEALTAFVRLSGAELGKRSFQ